jgi:hypothetical protein
LTFIVCRYPPPPPPFAAAASAVVEELQELLLAREEAFAIPKEKARISEMAQVKVSYSKGVP